MRAFPMMSFQGYMLIMWNRLEIFGFGGGEILLDLISPGIMIPNHSRWHMIFFFFAQNDSGPHASWSSLLLLIGKT